jgi:hypothetical protein
MTRPYRKLNRPNARALPAARDELEPDEIAIHRGRRKVQGSPTSIVEGPLKHFSKTEVENRVQEFLKNKIAVPPAKASTAKTTTCLPNTLPKD